MKHSKSRSIAALGDEKQFCALGIMSGTSLDGIDIAVIHTDGERVMQQGAAHEYPITGKLERALRGLMHGQGSPLLVELDYTRYVAECVNQFCVDNTLQADDIDVCGFHGQTIFHRPSEGISWQLGNGALLSQATNLPVMCDFRRRDIAAGGQGAPLVPAYHRALVADVEKPVVIVNIGGVANVTWVGANGELLAFDTGPGNALINDWVMRKCGQARDENGQYALAGHINNDMVQQFMGNDYFVNIPPKSLDRHSFSTPLSDDMSLEDGAATLTAITVESLASAQYYFPQPAAQWIICGGGRHNKAIMNGLAQALPNITVSNADDHGWRGDALEAEAFAFLAVRAMRGLSLTYPTTTGVSQPQTGGAFYCRPANDLP